MAIRVNASYPTASSSAAGYAATGAISPAGSGASGAQLTRKALRQDVSSPLRNLRPILSIPHKKIEDGPENPPGPLLGPAVKGPDPVLQRAFGPLAMPT